MYAEHYYMIIICIVCMKYRLLNYAKYIYYMFTDYLAGMEDDLAPIISSIQCEHKRMDG